MGDQASNVVGFKCYGKLTNGPLHSSIDSITTNKASNDDHESTLLQTIQLANMLEETAIKLRKQLNINIPADPSTNLRKITKRKISSRVTENIFIITVVWQLLCVITLEVVDVVDGTFQTKNPVVFVVGVTVMVLFQISNLIFALVVTIKLSKQYMHHTATMKFLLQSYFSTLFLFGGLYTFIGRLRPFWFANLIGHRNSKVYALEIFSQLLFTSISTGTLCGAASVTAVHPVTEAMMGIQMMLSFVYFASILSQVINPSLPTKYRSSKYSRSRNKTTAECNSKTNNSFVSSNNKDGNYGAIIRII